MLASGIESASFRFRVKQYMPYLGAWGIEAEASDLATSVSERARIIASAGDCDGVLVHRSFFRWRDYQKFQRTVKDYVFDFDDAIMFRDSSSRNLHSWRRKLLFKRMVGGARAVIAGNSYLGEWASRYNDNVFVIPTVVDLNHYPAEKLAETSEPVIGWIGTSVNLMYLRRIVPALVRMGHRARLKIVADDFLDVPGMEVIKKRWTLREEAADVMSFQIGIMPLSDDLWTRGKCALKIVQYFAARVPVVCSPVGANLDVVEDGRSGYFAATEDEWANRLEELLSDADKRKRFGEAARETVERKYSVQANIDKFAEILMTAKR